MTAFAETDSVPKNRPDAYVIGGGVVGLSVAHELADAGHSVEVISREDPREMRITSTSKSAIGQFLPFLEADHMDALRSEEQQQIVTDAIVRSRTIYEELSQSPEVTGIMKVRNIEPFAEGEEWPQFVVDVMDAKLKDLGKPISYIGADGKRHRVSQYYDFDTFSINTPVTSKFAADMLEVKGGTFTQTTLSKEELEELAKGPSSVYVAAGIDARDFIEDKKLVPIKGHTIIFRPEHPIPKVALSVADLILMPRSDGTFIVGALYLENNDGRLPHENEAEEILSRLKDVLSQGAIGAFQLDPNVLDEDSIVRHSAGVRPHHTDGLQIVTDPETHITHLYGFMGIGWSVAPGIAKSVVEKTS